MHRRDVDPSARTGTGHPYSKALCRCGRSRLPRDCRADTGRVAVRLDGTAARGPCRLSLAGDRLTVPVVSLGAYVLLGAVLGDLYMRRGAVHVASFGNRVLLPGGMALVALSFVGARVPLAPFGPTDFWSTSPNQFLLRAGLVLLLLGAGLLLGKLL